MMHLKRLLVSGAICSLSLTAAAMPLSVEAKRVVSVEFTETHPPSTDKERLKVYTASKVVLHYADGSESAYPLHYELLFHSGDKTESVGAGEIVDKDGKVIIESAPDKKGNRAKGPFYAYGPDGSSLIQVKNRKASNKLFLATLYTLRTDRRRTHRITGSAGC